MYHFLFPLLVSSADDFLIASSHYQLSLQVWSWKSGWKYRGERIEHFEGMKTCGLKSCYVCLLYHCTSPFPSFFFSLKWPTSNEADRIPKALEFAEWNWEENEGMTGRYEWIPVQVDRFSIFPLSFLFSPLSPFSSRIPSFQSHHFSDGRTISPLFSLDFLRESFSLAHNSSWYLFSRRFFLSYKNIHILWEQYFLQPTLDTFISFCPLTLLLSLPHTQRGKMLQIGLFKSNCYLKFSHYLARNKASFNK